MCRACGDPLIPTQPDQTMHPYPCSPPWRREHAGLRNDTHDQAAELPRAGAGEMRT
jgi:hypothetical protein